MANNKTQKSHLLECAFEIRSLIYGYVVSSENPIIRGRPERGNKNFLALLQVCKSVEREAAPIFYEQNLFRFHCRHSILLSSEQTLAVYDKVRAREGLSSYDDAQTTCPIIDVPKRYIKSLRNISLVRELTGIWPNGSLGAKKIGPQGFEIPVLEDAIDFLAARNTALNCLSIVLKRISLCGGVTWDPDPTALLLELNGQKTLANAVAKLANLGRLEIWKVRVTHWPNELKVPCTWTAVEPEALDQIKADHFPTAKAVLYTRRGEQEKHPHRPSYSLAEQFLIDFRCAAVTGRRLQYTSELERAGVDLATPGENEEKTDTGGDDGTDTEME
ncbi:hypothetical protein MMC07_005239 [Pseudocyphellaria aurata]|nr:hypothetical protein [Pseudocyphellaria aurata]